MNNNNSLSVYERFESNGLELLVNTNTGKAYASISAAARMLDRNESTIRTALTSRNLDVINAETPTATGLKTSRLLSAETLYDLAFDYNLPLAKKMGAAGANLYMLNLAGYKTKVVDKELEDAADYKLKTIKYTLGVFNSLQNSMFEPAVLAQLEINAVLKIDPDLKPLLEERKQLLINATATDNKLCTVTELASTLDISAVALNKLLIEKGLQTKIPTTSKTQSKYLPTERGKDYSKFTQSVDSNGTTFCYIKSGHQ